MKTKFKKLSPDATIPQKAHPSDAGYDLVATSCVYDPETGLYTYGTSIACAIPKGTVGLLCPRSSISKTTLRLSNSVGVIDQDYRGEIIFKFDMKFPNRCNEYKVGDRIGQLVVVPLGDAGSEEVEDLDVTVRGSGGFGSSGC